jgi:leucyl-tRNA synthetase
VVLGRGLGAGGRRQPHADGEVRRETLVKYHQNVKRVTEGMEELRYNTSIAALMELVNALRVDVRTQRTLVKGLVIKPPKPKSRSSR